MILKALGTSVYRLQFQLAFPEISKRTNETAFFQFFTIFGKENKLVRYTKFYKVPFQEFLFHFILIPEFLVVVSEI